MQHSQTRLLHFSWRVVIACLMVASFGIGMPGRVATPVVAQSAATDTAAGGQYTIPTGNVNVVWPAGWNVVLQNNNGIQLANASETMDLYISGVPFNGGTWEEAEAFQQGLYFNDQGDSATISGPVVTQSGFMFATDGQNGPRMFNAFASSDPLVYVAVGAINIAPGTDLTALVTEADGVTVDGVPALQGIEAVIPATTAASAPPAAGAGGQYTIPTGNVNVVWPAGWTVYAQTEESITLTNAAQTMLLQIMAIPVAGRTWDQIAANEVSFQMSGQGANGTVSGPVMTDSGFLFTSDGEQGPFMEQGLAATDPAMFIRINTGNVAPETDLTALATEAHGVTVDGTPALQGIEAVIPSATATEAGTPLGTGTEAGTPPATAAGGLYTIPTGNVNVVWPAGWTVFAQDEEGITLKNAAQTMALLINAHQDLGRTWDQMATDAVSFMTSLQGANGTVSGPVVTDSGFWFISDGERGPFMEQGLAAVDPAVYIVINAGNIAPGSDLTALATEAHGVTVDGKPALEGIEAVIPPAA